ncbi:hypothetical protein [Nonomuraea jiangxiensis]|uniref:Uncharacterized protein n=1 Tax=Nonomuraea jiangxiensis TaxID=633440 RepID=A0A1G8M3P1_9ACTN|nr:hypothetical protein [Nonomuraea jiangxiensis]SDI61990.1 hypothetical protein SAMN05421869_106279 [Nonomuraea jiangxiensis]
MSDLEHRYRRLLRLYPRDHRARHEEEMLGVLMAGAEPGRRRPHPRDAANLIGGAAAIRLRRPVSPHSLVWWRDAARVAAVLGPLVLLIHQFPSTVQELAMYVQRGPDPGVVSTGSVVEQALELLAYVAVTVLAWRDHRWLAAGLAWAGTIWLAVDTILPSSYDWRFSQLVPLGLLLLPYVAVAVLLTGTAHPRRGVGLVGRRKILIWSAVLMGATATIRLWAVTSGSALLLWEWVPLGLTAIICGMAARSPLGRRSIMLLAPVFLPVVLTAVVFVAMWSWLAEGSITGVMQAIVVMCAALAVFGITAYLTGRRRPADAPPPEAARP